METFQILVLVILMLACLASGVLFISTIKENEISTQRIKYVCHNAMTEKAEKINDEKLWQVQDFEDKSISLSEFVRYKTIDAIKFSDYFDYFRNNNIEIWYPNNVHDSDLQLTYEKVAKLVKSYKKCPNEPKFLYQTHLYFMVKKLMNDEFHLETKKNHFTELSRTSIIFYLAQKFKLNVRLSLSVKMNKNGLYDYDLSIVRTKRDLNYKIDNLLTEKNGEKRKRIKSEVLKRRKPFLKNPKNKKLLKEFDVEKFKSDLVFYIQNNNLHLQDLTKIENINIEKEKNNVLLQNDYIFLTMSMIEKDLQIFLDSKEEQYFYENLTRSDVNLNIDNTGEKIGLEAISQDLVEVNKNYEISKSEKNDQEQEIGSFLNKNPSLKKSSKKSLNNKETKFSLLDNSSEV